MATMNFGKYKGEPLSNVPAGYLQNLLKHTRSPKLARQYANELTQRNEPLVFCRKGKTSKRPRKHRSPTMNYLEF